MILTGNQIKMARENGYLDISDWDESRLNPNSYNLRLADELTVYGNPYVIGPGTPYEQKCIDQYGNVIEDMLIDSSVKIRTVRKDIVLDMAKEMRTSKFRIPKEGLVIFPGMIYLGQTIEHTKTSKFVPMLEGRSSIGRLGISIHSTAGFGDIGFEGYWTLEISCVQPVRIYPGVEICQIYYHTIAPAESIWIPSDDNPEIMKYDNGKYQKNNGVQASQLWKEFVE